MILTGFSFRITHRDGNRQIQQPAFRAPGTTAECEFSSHNTYLAGHVHGSEADVASGDVTCFLVGHLSNGAEVAALGGVDPNAPDDEILANAFRAIGPKAFVAAEGSFVAAILHDRNVMLAASKAAGPSLYFHRDAHNGELWVSTECSAFPSDLRRLRLFADLDESTFRRDPSKTVLQDVKRVVSGHCVLFDDAFHIKSDTYYEVPTTPTITDAADAIAQLQRVLAGAVQSWAPASVTCLVSGGLDSSIVALLGAEHHKDIDLVSVGLPDANEFAEAQKIGELLDRPVREVIASRDDYRTSYPAVVLAMEHHLSTYLEYMLALWVALRAVAPQNDVLSGYGSDTLFGGFATPSHTTAEIAHLTQWEYGSTYYANELSQSIWESPLSRFIAPYFDSAVIDLAMSIDPALKHQNGVEKAILRQAFEGRLGETLAWRKKLGVHHSAKTTDWLSAIVSNYSIADPRTAKDRLSYEILRLGLIEGAAAHEIDIDEVAQASLERPA